MFDVTWINDKHGSIYSRKKSVVRKLILALLGYVVKRQSASLCFVLELEQNAGYLSLFTLYLFPVLF